MVGLNALWLPMVLSAVLVFVASSVMHMVLRYHWGDMQPLPGEDGIRAAFRQAKVGPGNYAVPCPGSMKEMGSPEVVQKFNEGPVAYINVRRSGPPAMGPALVQWFLYAIGVGLFTAYLTGRALGPDAEYLDVFRFSGTVAFLGYAGALFQDSIWKAQRWSVTFKHVFDGLVYGLLTAGVFGWLWPGAATGG